MADLNVNTAATGERGAGTTAPTPANGGNGGRRPNAARVVLAVAAALVIAFCAWSMGEYVNGRDPLAFLSPGSSVASPSSAADSSASDSTPSTSTVTKASSVTGDDILSALGTLRYGSDDVSLSSDDARVVIAGDGVWVEERSSDDPADLVARTAERAAALAEWVRGRGVSVSTVTWITEDGDGVIRMVLCDGGDAKASGTLDELLAASKGYLISKQTYAGLDSPSFPRTSGAVPTLPDGSDATVDGTVTLSSGGKGEVVSQGTGSSSTSKTGATASGSASGSQSAGASSSSSGSAGGGSPSSTISVTVSIGGSSQRVSVASGSTAYAALLATGASVSAGANPYGSGTWVYGINGLAQDASHGWTYAVNGSMPSVMSDECTVHDGDVVTWSYV
jgi:hypothetical protein